VALKYALLAGLALEPRSGYDLTQWFTQVAAHYWAASHSSIYPTLAALERDGLIVHQTEPSRLGPVRKVYSLTAAGTSALLEWIDAPTSPIEVRDEQLVKALCYGLLPPGHAVSQLQAARSRYAQILSHYEEIASGLESMEPGDDRLSAEARLGALITLKCGIRVAAAYAAWCDEAAAMVEEAGAEGVERASAPPHAKRG
jgi:PadR family transcriptional regulator AphA